MIIAASPRHEYGLPQLLQGIGMAKQIQVRRLQDCLTIAGTAVIAFSVWSLAKIALFLAFVDEETIRQLIQVLGLQQDSAAAVTYASLLIIAIVDLGFRAYVGLSARAEGRGKKKSPFYLIIATIAAIANSTSLVGIALATSFASSILNMLVTVAIEATAIAALVLVIYSSIRLRQIRKTAE